MKTNELLKILKKGGCKPFRDAKGSHQIWHNPTTGEKCVVPIHPSKEAGKGLENVIIKKLLGK